MTKFKFQNKSKIKITNCYLTFVIWISFVICALSFDICQASGIDSLKVSLLEGDYKAVITEGEKVLGDPREQYDLKELYYILGISYLKEGNYLRAWDIFEIILNEFSDTRFQDEARLGIGDSFFLRQKFDKAQAYYKELLESSPDTKLKPQAYYRLSQIAFKLGDSEAGKLYADKLRQEFPEAVEAVLNKDLYAVNLPNEIYYTVQVGAFGNQINANNLTQRLIKAGYEAYIEENKSSSKVTYRVRVGKARRRPEAESLQQRLTQEGYPTKIFP